MSSKLPRALPRVTSMLCALATVIAVASCSEDAPSVSLSTTFRGELAMYIADFDDGHSETIHTLRRDDGSELRLVTAQAIAAQPGDGLEVRGRAIGDDLH